MGVWARRWGIPTLEVHRELPSTNDRVRELASLGAAAFTTVIAEAQTAGRGRDGRRWVSPPGVGLWLSTLVAPTPATASPVTPLLLGLAVVRAVRDVAPDVPLAVKWPNDVWVESRKLCGILCETGGGRGLVAGIGVNLAPPPADFPADVRRGAVALAEVSERPVSRSALAGRILHHARSLTDAGSHRLEGGLARELAGIDLLAGRSLATSTGVRGIGRGMAADGALLVERPDGTLHRVLAGSVRLLDSAERDSSGIG